MNYDAQEAAIGLLSLSPSSSFPPALLPLTTPTIPLKRKQPPQQDHQVQRNQQNQQQSYRSQPSHPPFQHRPAPQPRHSSTKSAIKHPSRVAQENQATDVSTESISCICGSSFDDGFSIACDDCSRWCHAACFDIVEGEVPEEWRCWVCVPRFVDRERAAKLQRTRQNMLEESERQREREREKENEKERDKDQQHGMQSQTQQQAQRRTSPGVDRKHRRTSAAAIDGSNTNRRRRRPSTASTHTPHPLPSPQDEPLIDVCVDIDEPWTHSYVHITEDIVPSPITASKLREHAQNWRGVSALSPYPPAQPPAQPPRTVVHPLPSSPSSVRPPSYAVRTTAPVKRKALIAPYTSTITPSAAYLADPLNGYAHLGMPKPFVHLVGPPLDVALDARVAGGEARFVRSGCWPNAVLRPVLCRRKAGEGIGKEGSRPREENEKEGGGRGKEGGDEDVNTDEDTTLSFAVFALRDLKAGEEVVLGWEWDDGNAVHALPALIQTPNMFPPAHAKHLRAQLANILHALGSTFTTCACGARAEGCAIRWMERVVDGDVPMSGEGDDWALRKAPNHSTVWGEEAAGRARSEMPPPPPPPPPPSVLASQPWQTQQLDGPGVRGTYKPANGDLAYHEPRYAHSTLPHVHSPTLEHITKFNTSVNSNVEGLAGPSARGRPLDLGPLLGTQRGFRARERVAWAGGMNGVEMVTETENRGEGSSEGSSWYGKRGESSRQGRASVRSRWAGERVAVEEEGKGGGYMDVDTERGGEDEDGDVDVEGGDEDVDMHVDGNGFSDRPRATTKVANPARKTRKGRGGENVDEPRPPDPGAPRPQHRVRIVEPNDRQRGVLPEDGWNQRCEENEDGGDDLSRSGGRERQGDGAKEEHVAEREEKMPPKMRKRWIHKELEVLRTTHRSPLVVGPTIQPDVRKLPTTSREAPTQSRMMGGESGEGPADLGTIPDLRPEQLGSLKGELNTSAGGTIGLGIRNVDTGLSMDVDVDFNATMLPPDTSLITPRSSTSSSGLSNSVSSPESSNREPERRPLRPLTLADILHPTMTSPVLSVRVPTPLPSTTPPPSTTSPSASFSRLHIVSPAPSSGFSPQASAASPQILGNDVLPHRRAQSSSPAGDGGKRSEEAQRYIEVEEQESVGNKDGEPVEVTATSSPSPLILPTSTSHAVTELSRENPLPHTALSPPSSPHIVSLEGPVLHPMDVDSPAENSEQNQSEPAVVSSPLPELQTQPLRSPTPPPRPPTPPPPPQKVKMTLKDFAARKKKQREEMGGSVGGGSVEVSPVVKSAALAPDMEGGAGVRMNERLDGVRNAEDSKVDGVDGGVIQGEQEGLARVIPLEELKTPAIEANKRVKDEDIEMNVAPEQNADKQDTFHRSPIPSVAKSLPPPTPLDLAGTINPLREDSASLQAKVERLDQPMPNGHHDDHAPLSLLHPPDHTIASNVAQTRSSATQPILPAPQSEEDGEIPNVVDDGPPPPKRPQPPASRSSYVPRSHTPPTQPRSFQATPPGYSPPPSMISRVTPGHRPLPLRAPRATSPATNTHSRPLPSGPRALRLGSGSYQPLYPPNRSFSGSPAPPRGPSADRDRIDWDRDRSWQARARPRGGNGWGR